MSDWNYGEKQFEDDPIRDIANTALWGFEWRMPDAQEDRARLARIFIARLDSRVEQTLFWEIVARFEAVDASLAVMIVQTSVNKKYVDPDSQPYVEFVGRYQSDLTESREATSNGN